MEVHVNVVVTTRTKNELSSPGFTDIVRDTFGEEGILHRTDHSTQNSDEIAMKSCFFVLTTFLFFIGIAIGWVLHDGVNCVQEMNANH